MNFPKTYIDLARDRISAFTEDLRREASSFSAVKSHATTGTTIVSLVSRDRKMGILASDGKVSGGVFSLKEDFPKVFDCRTGFIGAAGALGLIQRVVPAFRADLNTICDSRNELMTASGAGRRLFQFYVSSQSSLKNEEVLMAFIGLFWDKSEEVCHLYQLDGLSLLTREKERCTTIGSGSFLIIVDLENLPPLETKEQLLEQVRIALKKASSKDGATNRRMFYGMIDNGTFSKGEEVLNA